MPSVAELMNALPEVDESQVTAESRLSEIMDSGSLRPVPLGRLRRLGLLGTLQAKIAAAYLFYWIRGWFQHAADKERSLAEMHWRTAVQLLDSMSYLRGAAMKVGQTLANFPDIAPQPFVDTLDQLHFNAPPMHWSLMREMVHNELGHDPDELFASFDSKAFAAASLGQVHRATLHSGEEAVLKIQYPGIARAISEDLRNLTLFLLPARLGRDWENAKDQLEDLCGRLELETDYEAEAAALQKARGLFQDHEGILVPRVYSQFSTRRILTMERIPGVHLDQFIASNPSQELRNEVAHRLLRAWYRLMFTGRMLYVDFHPGNILILDDGRVGLIDFGMILHLNDELWKLFHIVDRALTTGRKADRDSANKIWCEMSDEEWQGERAKLIDQYSDWCWRSRYCGGKFDFGDEEDFREGVELFARMVARRYSRAKPCTPIIARSQFGWRSILYRLKAQVDIRELAEEEVKATGWDRSDYV